MADRYWRGGSGTWDESNTANWSTTSGGAGGASVPTAADNVIFDANSGSGTVSLPYISTVITSAGRRCNNLNVGDIPAGLVFSNADISYVDGSGTSPLGNAIAVWGTSFVLSGRSYTSGFPHPPIIAAGSGTLTIQATTTGGSNGYGFGLGILANKNVTFSGNNRIDVRSSPYIYGGSTVDTGFGSGQVSMGIYLQGGVFNGRGNWLVGSSNITYSGTLNLLATPAGGYFSYSQYGGTFSTSISSVPISGFRIYGGTLSYGSTTFTGSSAPFSPTWQVDPSVTFSGTSISVSAVTSFQGGGKNYASVTIGGGFGDQFSSGIVSNVNSSGNPAGTITNLAFGGIGPSCSIFAFLPNDITATSVALNNQSSPRVVTLFGTKGSGASTISSSNISSVSRVNFCNISFPVSVSGTDVGDGGGNTNITFSTPKTLYISQATNQYLNANIYATSSGGAPSTSNIPLAHDTIIFDSNSVNTNTTFYFYQGALGNFTCTSAPTGTGFYFYGVNQCAFFGNVTITSANVTSMSSELPLWGKGSTSNTVNITSTNSSRRGPDLQFYSGNYTLNGPFTSNNSIGLFKGTLTLQSGYTFDAGQLQIASSPMSESGRNLVFTLNMNGATLALGRYTSGGNLTTFNNYNFSSFTINSDASSSIELWDGTTNSMSKNIYFPQSSSVFPKMVFRGSNTGMTYRFTNDNGSYQFPEITELATLRSTATSFTINGSLDSSYALRVKKWSINGVSGVPINVISRFNYTGTGNVVAEYLTVTSSTATPANTWYAVNSLDNGGNSGWTFGAPFSGNGLLFGSNF